MTRNSCSKIILISACGFIAGAMQGEAKAKTIFQQVGIASSPNPVGSGARALGLGGAFIAVADDATAASWNPAGLIQLERPEFSIVGAYSFRENSFSSSPRPEADNSGKVDEASLNYLSASLPFTLLNRNVAASVNYQRLYEFKRKFHHEDDFSSSGVNQKWDKRFSQDGRLGAFGLASAIQITHSLSLGASLNIWTEAFWENGWKDNYTENGTGTLGGEPTVTETESSSEYSDFSGLNANLGLLWNMNRHLTVGAVVKTPFRAEMDHEFYYNSSITINAAQDPISTTRINNDERVALNMPLSYGGGLSVRFSDALTIDLDLYRTHWSDYILEDGDGNEFSPIDGRPKNESNVRNTTQVRLGGEYLFIGKKTVVPLRAGIFYDPEPSEDSVKKFYGVSIGSGLTYGAIAFDASYQFRWARNIDTGNLIATTEADVNQHTAYASVILHF